MVRSIVTAMPAASAAAKSTVHCRPRSIDRASESGTRSARRRGGRERERERLRTGRARLRERVRALVRAHDPVVGQQRLRGARPALGARRRSSRRRTACAMKAARGARPARHQRRPRVLLGVGAGLHRGDVGVAVGALVGRQAGLVRVGEDLVGEDAHPAAASRRSASPAAPAAARPGSARRASRWPAAIGGCGDEHRAVHREALAAARNVMCARSAARLGGDAARVPDGARRVGVAGLLRQRRVQVDVAERRELVARSPRGGPSRAPAHVAGCAPNARAWRARGRSAARTGAPGARRTSPGRPRAASGRDRSRTARRPGSTRPKKIGCFSVGPGLPALRVGLRPARRRRSTFG